MHCEAQAIDKVNEIRVMREKCNNANDDDGQVYVVLHISYQKSSQFVVRKSKPCKL